jgi:hypothetical protein
MKLQGPQGGVITWEVTAGAAPNQAVVADALGFTPRFDSANEERTRYIFGPAVNMGALCRVRAVTPRGERDIEHTVVLEDARVHEADEPWRPVAGVDPDPAISDGSSGGTGEGPDLVYMTYHRVEASSPLDTLTATITMRMAPNGQLQFDRTNASEGGGYTVAGQWISGSPVAPSVCELYEIRATLGAYGPDLPSGTFGSWLPGESSPEWGVVSFPGTGGGAFGNSASINIQVREKASGLLVESKVIDMQASQPGSAV